VIVKLINRGEGDQVPTVIPDWLELWRVLTGSVSLHITALSDILLSLHCSFNEKGDGLVGAVSVSASGKKDEVIVSIPELTGKLNLRCN